ncbi:MAG: hypothetical protein QM754_07555 [Tepidisphaeraceae bacterium]
MRTDLTARIVRNSLSALRPTLLGLIAAGTLAGCASDGVTPENSSKTNTMDRPGVTPAGTPGPSPTANRTGPGTATPAANADGVTIPPNARYTIVCTSFTGAGHVQSARQSKENLVRATGKNEFYIIHDEAQSTLYYGYYRERDRVLDPAEAGRSLRDLEYLRSLVQNGQRIFSPLVVPLPTPDPIAPPEYDLAKVDADKDPNDPTRRFWTIVIADYSNDVIIDGKGRKQIVIEAVTEARKMGIEAYFYNGPHSSSVCIGAWPRKAIREQEADIAQTPEALADNGQELLVADRRLTDGEMEEIKKTGRDIKVMEKKVEVDDPSLLQIWSKYKDYSLNGNIEMLVSTDPKTGEKKRRPKETFLAIIPREKPVQSILAGGSQPPQQQEMQSMPQMPNPLTPGASGTSGAGQLRSIGR